MFAGCWGRKQKGGELCWGLKLQCRSDTFHFCLHSIGQSKSFDHSRDNRVYDSPTESVPKKGDNYIIHEWPWNLKSVAPWNLTCVFAKAMLLTKDLWDGDPKADLFWEAGDSFASVAQGVPNSFVRLSLGTWWFECSSTPSLLGVILVLWSDDSLSCLQLTPYFLSPTHLPVKSLYVHSFLGRVYCRIFYWKKKFRRKKKQSWVACESLELRHLYSQIYVGISDNVSTCEGKGHMYH